MEAEIEKLIFMEDRLKMRVVGQDVAITAVSNAVRRARAGLQDPNRPIGSFIFLGPTGVGKTELGRTLAEYLFDDERMPDGQGRVVDFKNTVIIMTSNVGSQYLTEPGLSHEEMRRRVMEALRAPFPPEFLTR